MEMSVTKKDIVQLLEEIALYMEIKGDNPFRISAFRRAARSIETLDQSLEEIPKLTDIPGVGKGTEAVILEYMENGTSEVLESLKEEVPAGLISLLQLPGLGGKKISRLYKELQVTDMESLKTACEEGRVGQLKGFGPKTQENILKAILEYGKQPERLPIAYMLSLAEKIEAELRNMPAIQQFSRAGSLRRVQETIKDLDFVIATDNPENVKENLLQLKGVSRATSNGDTKVTLIFSGKYDVSVDFRFVQPNQFATLLHHFTGSKDHNVRMRQLAKERGEKISEYGVEHIETGTIKTFQNEEEFFHHFGLSYIPPEVREDGTEVDKHEEIQELITASDIKGDLHLHTTWSDGAHSLEEMIHACREKGYRYMAITDHSQYLKVANGLTIERLKRQMEEIYKLKEKYTDIKILSGIEMDILPDGELDFPDEILKELDIVIASIHSSFNQSRETIMERLHAALNHPYVDIIAHPTGRLIGKRNGYDVDIDALIEGAKKTNTILELNANPYRFDLAAPYIRKAQEAGVKIVINTDAHDIRHLDYMDLGVSVAKQGWIKTSSVINTYDYDELLSLLKRNQSRNG